MQCCCALCWCLQWLLATTLRKQMMKCPRVDVTLTEIMTANVTTVAQLLKKTMTQIMTLRPTQTLHPIPTLSLMMVTQTVATQRRRTIWIFQALSQTSVPTQSTFHQAPHILASQRCKMQGLHQGEILKLSNISLPLMNI